MLFPICYMLSKNPVEEEMDPLDFFHWGNFIKHYEDKHGI